MKSSAYALTEQDFLLFREMKEWFRRQTMNTRNRPDAPSELGTAPEVYIARTPSGGIPALSTGAWTMGSGTGTVVQDDVPGSATECWIFCIESGVLVPLHVKQTVYNLSLNDVEGDLWIPVVRDKFGSWLVAAGGTGGSGGGSSPSLGGCVGPVHVVDPDGTGTGTAWYCQEVFWNGSGWYVSPGPVNYTGVIEINGMQPRRLDTDPTEKVLATAVTLLYRDPRGQYFIDYPRLGDYDTLQFPSAWVCSGGNFTPSAYTTVRFVVDNFTNFPNIDVRVETV